MNDCTCNSQYFEVDGEQNEVVELLDGGRDDDKNEQPEDADNGEEILWSIDDDTLFHPLGLINHGTESKSVFITWSEDYLLNYVFKKSQRNQRTKVTKVRLDVHGEEIRNIIILEFNTLLLMRSGRAFYFSSVKSMRPIKWLLGVRCISAAVGGFSVIRLLPDKSLRLEVYRDVIDMEHSESTLKISFDITFDDINIFNCMWEDERFTLLSERIDETNMKFLENILGDDCKLSGKPEIHFFTVSGNLFALIPESEDNEDYHIQLCATYASNIEFLKILIERQLFVVFLQCGTIEIWYRSNFIHLLKRSTYCTGAHITHYEFANNCFYYADAEKVGRLKFNYDPSTDTCYVQESSKAIFGILACTWMESIHQLICLSCNNIFYQIGFDEECVEDDSNALEFTLELYELTPAKMARLLQKAEILNQWQTAPAEIHKAIEQEYLKQELITIATKSHLYRKLCSASVEYRKYLVPTVHHSSETIIMHASSSCALNSNSLFALIYIKITRHAIFQAGSTWQIHVLNKSNSECYIFSIPLAMLHKTLCLAIPISAEKQKLLPQFQVMLNAFVSNDSDFAAISLPIKLLQSPESIRHLFSWEQPCLPDYVRHDLSNLIAEFNKHPAAKSTTPFVISCKFGLSKTCNLDTISRIFNIGRTKSFKDIQLHELVMYFISNNFKISYSLEDECIYLECEDAAVLYYAKYFILSNLSGPFSNVNDSTGYHSDRRKSILQFQAEVEHSSVRIVGIEQSDTLQLENLQRIYSKMRKELCNSCLLLK